MFRNLDTQRFVAYLTLISGLSISAVAVYYSVAGLISIFAASVIPIAIMGTVLELSKLVATVWLKQNWFIAPKPIRYYLLSAVIILMFITSMGIFGYLSRAHLDQAVPTGDVAAKVALLDEKIKIERENIANAQQVVKQMDAAVNGVIATGDQEVKLRDGSTRIRSAAERSLQIRRSQAKDRATLSTQIEEAQVRIVKLQEERAPIASQLRKVEAEVGPIKYIAALIYGDNPDNNLLERAVRWVIIVIVIVFDPFAVALLLASQYSFQYFRDNPKKDDDPSGGDDTPPNDKDGKDDAIRTSSDDDGVDESGDKRHEPTGMVADQQPVAAAGPRVEYKILDDYSDEEYEPPVAAPVITRPVTAEVTFGEPVIEADRVQESVTKKATQRLRKMAEDAAERAGITEAAPPGTPEETWTTSPSETAAQDVDDLDKIYREASAAEAKKKRSRGWLQSSFPTRK